MRTLPWIKLLNLYSVSECHDVATADLTNMPFQNEVCLFHNVESCCFQTSKGNKGRETTFGSGV